MCVDPVWGSLLPLHITRASTSTIATVYSYSHSISRTSGLQNRRPVMRLCSVRRFKGPLSHVCPQWSSFSSALKLGHLSAIPSSEKISTVHSINQSRNLSILESFLFFPQPSISARNCKLHVTGIPHASF